MAITLILSQSLLEYLRDPFLDSVLFLLYINDLPNASKLLSFHSFADDTNIYCSRKNLNDLELILNQELHAVAEWMKSNSLCLKFSDIIHLEILSFVYQWYHKLNHSCFVNYFNLVSSIHSYNTRQSQIDTVHATQ